MVFALYTSAGGAAVESGGFTGKLVYDSATEQGLLAEYCQQAELFGTTPSRL